MSRRDISSHGLVNSAMTAKLFNLSMVCQKDHNSIKDLWLLFILAPMSHCSLETFNMYSLLLENHFMANRSIHVWRVAPNIYLFIKVLLLHSCISRVCIIFPCSAKLPIILNWLSSANPKPLLCICLYTRYIRLRICTRSTYMYITGSCMMK